MNKNKKIIITASVTALAVCSTGVIVYNSSKSNEKAPDNSSVASNVIELAKLSYTTELPVSKSLSAKGILASLGEANGGISEVSFKNSEVNIFDLSSLGSSNYSVLFSNGNANMVFSELGEYSEVLSVLIEGELIAEVSIKGTVVDKVAPVFSGIKDIVATEGIEYDARAGVSVSDNYDKTVDFGVNGLTYDLGEHIITYRAIDSSGNTTEVTAKLTVQQAEVVTEPVVVEPVAPPSNSGGGSSGGSSGGSTGGSSKPSVAPTPPPTVVEPVAPPAQPVAPPVAVLPPTPAYDPAIMDAGGKLWGVPHASYNSQEVAWFNYAFNASRAYGASLEQSETWAMNYVSGCSSVGESNVVVGDPVGVGFSVWWYNPIENTWKTG